MPRFRILFLITSRRKPSKRGKKPRKKPFSPCVLELAEKNHNDNVKGIIKMGFMQEILLIFAVPHSLKHGSMHSMNYLQSFPRKGTQGVCSKALFDFERMLNN